MRQALSKLVVLVGTALLAACANPGVPVPPSLELPSPVGDLRAVRKGNSVYLSWTVPIRTTEQQSVRHMGQTRVCRSLDPVMKQCSAPVAEFLTPTPTASARTTAPTTATYVDTVSTSPAEHPTDVLAYAVEVLNSYSRSAGLSNQVRVPLLPAVPPPDGFRAEIAANGVRVSWSCPSAPPASVPNLRYRVRVFRQLDGARADSRAGEVDLMDCQRPQVVDQGFEWEKTYAYRAAVITIASVTGQPDTEVEGDDTPVVKILAHDTFPPTAPSGLQAVFSGVGQQPFIDLVWTPVADSDLAGYNVYRHEEGTQPVKVNADLAKAPAYRDTTLQTGRRYFYSVSAVDLRGNESGHSDEADEAVP